MDKVLGLQLDSMEEEKAQEDVIKLANARIQAKKEKDYAKSDQLREQIELSGYKIEDSGESYKLVKNE